MSNGLIIAYTGEGKGKTTAALGMALRAAGYGKKTKVVQFIKGPSKTGEKLFSAKNSLIKIISTGLGFVGILGDTNKPEAHQEAAKRALNIAEKAIESAADILVLDEIFVALDLGLVDETEVLRLLDKKRSGQTLVLTGRGARKKILERCDLVTEMRKIKHPFDSGVKAIKSIDY